MSSPDPLLLARIQFAANVSFHILFPTITIALSWMLLWFKWRYARSGDPAWMELYGFWAKVFALAFALGVVSGVTMSFQFGTNWPGFMNTVGNIAGPLLAYEVLTAFFLEASFLAIMLYGYRRVSDRVHTLATFLVALGTTLSAFWILVLNSWMQTPAGFELRDGVAHPTDWWAIVFNPSMPWRFAHMMLASFLTVAFLLAGLSAWRHLRGDRRPEVALGLRTGIRLAAVLIPLQIVVGDLHGLNSFEHQPAKVAAIEAIWETQRGAPLTLVGWPDEEARRTRLALEIPKAASLILTHDADGEVPGLDRFPGLHPPVAPVFWSFRIMVAVGVLMLLASWLAAWQGRGGRAPPPGTLRLLVAMSFSGWIATLAGWYTTEIGRQPWLVQDVLTTAAAAGPVPAGPLGFTLAVYLLLYLALTVAFVRVLFRLAAKAEHAPAFGQRTATATS
ncbi:MAG: cytochrome ubiquinol oxidase subunit I [Xanthomonadales bacterium]|nr:cytochrome ubiquinol oxidase subunit I [Xanthomonadales bacterium]